MEIEKLYLFITIAQSYDKELPISSRSYNVDTALSNINGEIIQASSKFTIEPNITEPFWKEHILSIVLYSIHFKNGTYYITLLYILKPETLNRIVSSENTDTLNIKLIQETFPAIDSELNGNNRNYKLMFLDSENLYEFFNSKVLINSYLLAFPTAINLKNLDHSNSSKIELLNAFESSINRSIKSKVEIPFGYFDFLESVSHHFVYSQIVQLRIFIALSSFPGDRIVIPRSIKQLVDLDIILHVMDGMNSRLETLYLQSDRIKSYIDSMSNKNVFKNYSVKYKHDRLSYIETKFDIIDNLRNIKKEIENMPANSSDKYRDSCLLRGITNCDVSYSYAMHDMNLNKFETAKKRVEETLQNISDKDNYINEFIRDVISIESMWGNLKIQKIVTKLNYIIIGLGIASLLASIFGDEIKEWISIYVMCHTR